jgi:hypothetical protein
MKKIITPLIIMAFVAGLTRCVYNKEEILYPQLSSGCDTTNVTFSGKVSPIISDNCLRCHGNDVAIANGGGMMLEGYSNVKANINRVYGAISHLSGYSAMPKDGSKLSDCTIQTVKIWKDAGALNN